MCKETEKKEIFESLTIVIFSKNREDELRNLIEYLEPYKPRILLLDGTPGGYQRISLRSDSTHVLGSSIAKRAEFASNYLTTEFAALLSDDDLLDMSGVSSAIQYLKSNKAVGCVFSVRNFSDYYVEKRINFRKYNLLKESPQERLVDWAKTGSEFYWRGVWRSEDLRKVLKFLGEALKTFSEDTALHGPLVSLYGSSLSKLKFIDKDLYLSRSWGPKIDTSMLKVSLRESRNQFGIEESEMEKLPIFLNILAEQLSPIFNLPVSDTLDRVNSSLKRYQEYIIRSREPSFLNQCVAIIRGKILQEYVNLLKRVNRSFSLGIFSS